MKSIRTIITLLATLLTCSTATAQGWPMDYDGVMMQGFYWDSYQETKWTQLEDQAEDIAPYFSLIWIPQSGRCKGDHNQMGYIPCYYFDQNSSFGTTEELRSMISTYRKKGTRFIADVVLNHRDATDGWTGFPAETYNNVRYQMKSTDVCRNDDGGYTATQSGTPLSQNNDTGDDWPGTRDLDHKSENVQQILKAYMRFLIEDIGYAGFRFDMVKGFWASFIGDYTMASKPPFSVGEYWSGSDDIKNWINNTKGHVAQYPTSAAFDFPFRYHVKNAANSGNWRSLADGDTPLAYDSYFRQYAVTFVENHDSEKRPGKDQDPIWKDTLAANAFLLSMPGTPCVFYRHWAAYPQDIKNMILIRKLAGITNTCGWEEAWRDDAYYATKVYGKHAQLITVVGREPDWYNNNDQYFAYIHSGKGYKYYLERKANTVWIDLPSGSYHEEVFIRPRAVSNLPGAQIVYTTDGTTPNANSPRIGSGEQMHLTYPCTLKMGILSNGTVTGIQERKYNIIPFTPHAITVYWRNENTWDKMNCYAWDNKGTLLNGIWPGMTITGAQTRLIQGIRWYYQTFQLPKATYRVNVVFCHPTKDFQTVDVRDINQNTYLVISKDKADTKYLIRNVTEDYESRIGQQLTDYNTSNNTTYDMSGRRTAKPTRGIYIRNGRKILY